MATILLSAAGAAIGSGFGGTVLGLSGAVIGRAVGATLGRSIDQRIMGSGSDVVETGRVDRFRLMGASEGTAIARVWGRVRISGQVVWATRFQEHFTQSGGKGAPQPRTQNYYYSVSLAVALCEGVISRVGRIWADGNEIPPGSLEIRVYKGAEDQLPDPKIQAVEGSELAPAYRGTAYVVIEDLDLSAYGNRVPQFSFEVVRPAQGNLTAEHPDLSKVIKGVCLIPGTGEYALATTPVHYNLGPGRNKSANVNSTSGKTDFTTSLEQLTEELPECMNVSIVASWFGADLRCANCEIRPKVEQTSTDGIGMAWKVSGVARSDAIAVPTREGRSVYGGSPADQSVIESIRAIHDSGKAVTFYPFILMEQLAGNNLPNPWDSATEQPALPWRGRITLNIAPGLPGTVDRTASAESQVSAFFGNALPTHFLISEGTVLYSGPLEWSYRRFILHYATLCKMAGGIEAFCIGSEMRSLTQIRGSGDSFPAVIALRQLAADVRLILGESVKISYAADWSEYFGYHVGNSVYFHLDELWADPEIDFIGVDNYMPVSDWRDGESHADAGWDEIHNKNYLLENISGGEGYDWYYDGPESEFVQLRTPIVDQSYGEDWVFRYKDLRGWWSNSHNNRIDGVKLSTGTPWIPESKPIVFTEYGCAAIDKGTNQPNRFLDSKSSESGLPRYSNGQRDDLIQFCYYQAISEYWTNPLNNPLSGIYNSRMIDVERSLAWAWDARPYPVFPGNTELWDDGNNYQTGHWLNGRASNQNVAAVISEICASVGVDELNFPNALGLLRGFSVMETSSPRSSVQPLLLTHGIDAVERGSELMFRSRSGRNPIELGVENLVLSSEIEGYSEARRSSDLETPRRMRIAFTEAEKDFSIQSVEASFANFSSEFSVQSELPLVLTTSEAIAVAERWLSESQVSRDTLRFALPRSKIELEAGDTFVMSNDRFRVDRVERHEYQLIDSVKIDPRSFQTRGTSTSNSVWHPYLAPVPVFYQFLDLPLLPNSAVPYAPYIAAVSIPWLGSIGVWSSVTEDGFKLETTLNAPAVIGVTESELAACSVGLWDRGPALRVRTLSGGFLSASEQEVLLGSNTVAIGDGTSEFWEVFQFSKATLLAPGTYDLSDRLRGQLGTDAFQPNSWPVGSLVVLLNSEVVQIDHPDSSRGLSRFYKIGPTGGLTSGNDGFTFESRSFNGIGLRPYSVVHAKIERNLIGDFAFDWTRRTRIGGDSWQANEVPLAEEFEQYLVSVSRNDVVLREDTVRELTWVYSIAMQLGDGASGLLVFSVSQVSQSFGVGPAKRIEFEI